MTDHERGRIAADAATVYEEFFVPALFQQWSSRVAEAADIATGDRVLDVACGTGVLARTVAQLVGPSGSVAAIDVNEAMLAVAQQASLEIDWRAARAEALPFPDHDFDAVVSQFGLISSRIVALPSARCGGCFGREVASR